MSEAFYPEMNFKDVLIEVRNRLKNAGIESPEREARLLVVLSLNISQVQLILRENQPVGEDLEKIIEALKRREKREPLSRIFSMREFYGLEFKIGSATLDPREDSETLVNLILDECKRRGLLSEDITILDLGTGTGALLLSILHNLPNAQGVGVDISSNAIKIANENAYELDLTSRVQFKIGNMFEGLQEKFHIIISNPPYIPRGEIEKLDPEVRLYDPHLALDGGEDGLDFYRKIIDSAPQNLQNGGLIAFEVGYDQAEIVKNMLHKGGFLYLKSSLDIGGVERALLAQWGLA